MHIIDRTEGEAVRLGRYVLRILEVNGDEVVFALIDGDEDADNPISPDAVEYLVS